MLKHTSNAGGPANGQVRNNSTTSTARNIHLRPQQPLNISTLNSSNLQTSTTATTTSSIQQPRFTNLLNIAAPPPPPPSTNGPNQQTQHQPPPPPSLLPLSPTGNGNTTNTTTTPITPILNHLTPNGLNGIGNNLHTYTNQHIALAHAAASAATCNGNLANSTILNQNPNINNNNNNITNHTNYTNYTNPLGAIINQSKHGPGPREALTSLGLLCLGKLTLYNSRLKMTFSSFSCFIL